MYLDGQKDQTGSKAPRSPYLDQVEEEDEREKEREKDFALAYSCCLLLTALPSTSDGLFQYDASRLADCFLRNYTLIPLVSIN